MKLSRILILTSLVLIAPNLARSQVAGSTVIGVAQPELREIAQGWSARLQVLGKPIFNDQGDWIGNVDDIIIAPGRATSYAIIDDSFFINLNKHHVAVPVSRLDWDEGKLVLPGATVDALKASPEFQYARR